MYIFLLYAVKTNDMMLVIYLSSLIRSVIALHNLINNKVTMLFLTPPVLLTGSRQQHQKGFEFGSECFGSHYISLPFGSFWAAHKKHPVGPAPPVKVLFCWHTLLVAVHKQAKKKCEKSTPCKILVSFNLFLTMQIKVGSYSSQKGKILNY